MAKGGWTYILTNKPHGVLYIGVTADLPRRLDQHLRGEGPSFARRYNLQILVLCEHHATIEEAIAREKTHKAWKRAWKVELIERCNPNWEDVAQSLLA